MSGEQILNNIHIFVGLSLMLSLRSIKSVFCFGFRFHTKLKMWSSITIITTRSLNHQLDVMKNHTSTWCPKSTERYVCVVFFKSFLCCVVNRVLKASLCLFRSQLNILNLDWKTLTSNIIIGPCLPAWSRTSPMPTVTA